MWLTKYPENTHPPTETAAVSSVTAQAVWLQSRKLNPTNSTLGPNDPEHTASLTRLVAVYLETQCYICVLDR